MDNKQQKIAVFDFDKTLTYKDTNWSFFLYLGKGLFDLPIKLFIYLFLKVICKFKYISNNDLKNMGLLLFFKNKSLKSFECLSEEFSKTIELNNIIKNKLYNYMEDGYRVIIITASFKYYVSPIFPSIEVFGSEVDVINNRIRLTFHCYKENKIEVLKKNNITKIDVLYTDSLSDLPLARLSDKIFFVKKSNVTYFKTFSELEHFIKYK